MDDDQARARQLLGVGRAATADEVRAAYMDLVKVWHPDRFGSDARLREKAERQLRAINEAFALLAADVAPPPRRSPAASPVRVPQAGTKREPRAASTPARAPSGGGSAGASIGWVAFGVLVLAGLFYSYANPPAAPPGASPSPAATAAPASRVRATRAAPSEPQFGPATVVPASPSDYTGQLSAEETKALMLACSDKQVNGDVYQKCLAEQVEDAKAAPKPDYSDKERQRASVERECEAAKARGPAAYRNCQSTELSSRPTDPKPN